MIPYGRQDISKEDIDIVLEVLNSDFLTQGPKTPLFEKTIANYCDVQYAVAVNSATSALHAACFALELGEKDYLSMIKLNKIQKPSINFNAIKTIPAIRVLEQIVSVPHLLYWKSDFWKNNIKITHIEHKLFKKYKNIDIFKLGEKI